MIEPPRRTSQRIRAARAHTRPHGLSTMLLAFSVLFVLAYVFIIRTPPQPPAPVLRSASGTYTWQSASADGAGRAGGGAFAATAGGDATGAFRPDDESTALVSSSYDAGRRSEWTTVDGAERGGAVTVGAWPPVWRLSTHSPLELQGLSAIVRAAVEDGDTSVGIKPLEQDGREVWRAALKLDGATQELVVDQSSGLVTWWTDGSSTFAAGVDWATLDGTPSPGASTLGTTAPATVTVDRTYTYERSSAAAGEAAGFDPLVSSLAPDGFVQAAVATAAAGDAPAVWGSETGGSTGAGSARQIVQLFTRGLTWFEVRQVGPTTSPAAFESALETARATALSFEQTPLEYGVFAGRTAATWYAATGPTLLVGNGRRAVYVTGALTRQELLSLAEGFEQLTAGATASPAASATP